MSARNPFSVLFINYAFKLAVLESSASRTDPIRVSLQDNNRTDVPYECISYDRSKDSGTAKIYLEDEEVDIPAPLEAALRVLRKPDAPRLLWADVLLGQTPQQLNEQAALAKSILQNAKRTIVWLGPGLTRTAEAFSLIKTMAIWWNQAAIRCDFPKNLSRATNNQLMAMVSYFVSQDPTQLRGEDEELWLLMFSIFESAYFESVQSIPDIILSEDVVITSGTSRISWPNFTAAFQGLLVALPQVLGKVPSPALQESFGRIGSIQLAETRMREDSGLELLPMVQTAKDAHSPDPREYVFAMLPLVRRSKRTQHIVNKTPMPIVDYTKSPQEVFTEAAKFIIEDRQDLLIWWAERPPCGHRLPNLPSWAPDWTAPLPTRAVRISAETNPSLRQWSDSVKPQKPIRIVDNKLQVQVHKLDKIKTVSPIFTTENCRRLVLTEWQNLLTVTNISMQQKVENYWRTILLNIGGATRSLRQQAPPPQELWESFQSVLAEERIFELMSCTPEELMTDPDVLARARADPQCQILAPQAGRSTEFNDLLYRNSIGRRFFTTENGRMGMSAFEEPPELQEGVEESGVKVGDVVVAVIGGYHPYVVREVDRAGPSDASLFAVDAYQFVGDCYLHGAMNGECFQMSVGTGLNFWRTDLSLLEDIKMV